MISFVIGKAVFSSKLGMFLWSLPFVTLAVTEAFLGQMIIALVVALIGAAPPTVAIIMLSRKQSEERRAQNLELLQNQKTMAENLDGKLDRLSRAENAQAKAEGIIEGGDKEQARAAIVPPPVAKPDPDHVSKMEIVNQDDNAVPTRVAKPDKVK